MFKIKNIVVPTDLSRHSISAFDYAASLAEQFSATIHLVHILDKIPPLIAVNSLKISEEELMQSLEDGAIEKLEETTTNLRRSTTATVVSAIRKGVDYEEIISYATELNAELIVIATHGRTGVLHTLLGSVAEKIIRFSKIPVLVTTPAETEN